MDKYQALLWGLATAAFALYVYARMLQQQSGLGANIYMAASVVLMFATLLIWLLCFLFPTAMSVTAISEIRMVSYVP